MKKVKVNINRPVPDSDRIAQTRNFSKVVAKYHWYTNMIKLGGIGSISVIVIATVYLINPFKDFSQKSDKKDAREMQKELANISDEKSRMALEKNDDTIAIAITSIGKTSDSKNLETDVKSLPIDSTKKEIPFKDKSTEEAEKTNAEKKKALEIQIEILTQQIGYLKSEINKLLKETPFKPEEASGYTFKLDILPDQFPELQYYQDILFEVTKENPDFDPSIMQKEWENIKLEKVEPTGKYSMVISKGKKNVIIKVKPVFKGLPFRKANEKFQHHESTIQNLITQEKEKNNELEEQKKLILNL